MISPGNTCSMYCSSVPPTGMKTKKASIMAGAIFICFLMIWLRLALCYCRKENGTGNKLFQRDGYKRFKLYILQRERNRMVMAGGWTARARMKYRLWEEAGSECLC